MKFHSLVLATTVLVCTASRGTRLGLCTGQEPGPTVAEEQDAAPNWSLLPPRGGRIEERKGALVLHLTGSIEERGFAEGYLLADQILECFNEFALGHVVAGNPRLWDFLIRPGIQSKFLFDDRTSRWAAALVVGMELAREGDLELRGLGRAFDAKDALCTAAIPDLAGFLCSSFAAWGDATTSENVLVARNLDYPSTPAVERHSLIKVHAPIGDLAGWVGIGWPGAPGCLTGLSDRGVFVAIHDVSGGRPKGDVKATPRTLALEALITKLQPGTDAAQVARDDLRRHRFTMGGNVMLAWQARDGSSRGAAVLELDTDQNKDSGTTLRLPKEGQSVIACSNDHYAREGSEPSCSRYGCLFEGASQKGVDESRAWALIKEAGMQITLYRCVANLGEGTLGVERSTDEGWQARETIKAWE